MDIVHPRIAGYIRRLAAARDPVLRTMERIAWRRSFPIIGPEVGALLRQLALISKARRILEMGFESVVLWSLGREDPEILPRITGSRSTERAP